MQVFSNEHYIAVDIGLACEEFHSLALPSFVLIKTAIFFAALRLVVLFAKLLPASTAARSFMEPCVSSVSVIHRGVRTELVLAKQICRTLPRILSARNRITLPVAYAAF